MRVGRFERFQKPAHQFCPRIDVWQVDTKCLEHTEAEIGAPDHGHESSHVQRRINARSVAPVLMRLGRHVDARNHCFPQTGSSTFTITYTPVKTPKGKLCAKGSSEIVFAGKVTGGTGAALKAMPKGQRITAMSASAR